jgi:hypothetical protein
MKNIFVYMCFIACFCSYGQAQETINISGTWAFALDPGDVGINEQWYSNPLEGKIQLPGSLQEQGYGEDVSIAKAKAANQWHIWVYPEKAEKEAENASKLYFTTNYGDAVAKTKTGKTVLYCLPDSALKPEKGGNIAVGFSSIFWNTSWTRNQAPHTLGIYCNPAHPAFAAFPNEGYSNYQWWDIIANSSAILMDDFPADFRPVVYLIDDWFTNRRLRLLLETKVGAGKMMVCSSNLVNNSDKRPAARQFRRSIEQYMASDKFHPTVEIYPVIIHRLLKIESNK